MKSEEKKLGNNLYIIYITLFLMGIGVIVLVNYGDTSNQTTLDYKEYYEQTEANKSLLEAFINGSNTAVQSILNRAVTCQTVSIADEERVYNLILIDCLESVNG